MTETHWNRGRSCWKWFLLQMMTCFYFLTGDKVGNDNTPTGIQLIVIINYRTSSPRFLLHLWWWFMLLKGVRHPSDSDWHLINGLCLAESHLLVILSQRRASRGYVALEGLTEAWSPSFPNLLPVLNPQMCEELQITKSKWLERHPEHQVELPLLVPSQYKHGDGR